MSETVALVNPFSVPVDFGWSSVNDAGQESQLFSVHPAKGTVPAESTVTVDVTYAPKTSHKAAVEPLALLIAGGLRKKLTCYAELEATTCSIRQKDVAFGDVCIGGKYEKVRSLART